MILNQHSASAFGGKTLQTILLNNSILKKDKMCNTLELKDISVGVSNGPGTLIAWNTTCTNKQWLEGHWYISLPA